MILAFTFGTLVAMGLPILSAVFGLLIGLSLIGLLGHLVQVPDIAPTLATMIGLGVGIDYALFLVTRYRAEFAEGKPTAEAIATAVATSGSAIVFAGTTVVLALLTLLVAGIPLVTALGYASAFAVVTAVAASLTLLPAILAALGPRINRLHLPALRIPGRRARNAEQPSRPAASGFWVRWAAFVTTRPGVAVLLALLILLPPLVPFMSIELGQEDVGATPEVDHRAPGLRPDRLRLRPGLQRPPAGGGRARNPGQAEQEVQEPKEPGGEPAGRARAGAVPGPGGGRPALVPGGFPRAVPERARELRGHRCRRRARNCRRRAASSSRSGPRLSQERTLRAQLDALAAETREVAAEGARLAAEAALLQARRGELIAAQGRVEAKLDRSPPPGRRQQLQRRLARLQSREAAVNVKIATVADQRAAVSAESEQLAARARDLRAQAAALGGAALALGEQATGLLQQAVELAQQKEQLEQDAADAQVQAANLQAEQAELEATQQVAQIQGQQAQQLQKELTKELTAAGGDERGTDQRLVKLQNGLEGLSGVAVVSPPVINGNGKAAYFNVISTTDPADPATADLVVTIREFVIPQRTQGEDVEAHVGGSTAANVDLATGITARLGLVIAAVIALGFVVLMMAFRSILIPAQAALDQRPRGARRLRRGRRLLPVRLGALPGRRRHDLRHRSDRELRAADHVRRPLRALDGLPGVPSQPDRAASCRRRQRPRGDRRGARHGRARDLGRRVDHDRGLRQLHPQRRSDRQAVRRRALGRRRPGGDVGAAARAGLLVLAGKGIRWLPAWAERRLPHIDVEGAGAAQRAEAAEPNDE